MKPQGFFSWTFDKTSYWVISFLFGLAMALEEFLIGQYLLGISSFIASFIVVIIFYLIPYWLKRMLSDLVREEILSLKKKKII